MPLSSMDQIVAAISAGKSDRYDTNKITGAAAYTSGRWYDLSQLSGIPVANSYPGTALAWQACTETAGNGVEIFGIQHRGNVSPDFKQLLNMAASSTSSTGVPATLMLVDMEGYYPGVNMNLATAQTFTGTPVLRAPNGNGVRAFLTARATTGATAHNISYSYTNQAGTAGRANPVTVAATASAITPHILHSGTSSNNYGPWLPMASGDFGIRSFQSLTLSAASGTASTAALVLCVPIAQIAISAQGLLSEKDLVNQIPSMPRIRDGACLTWLLSAGSSVSATTQFNVTSEVVWG